MEEGDDTDSTYGDASSSTASLSASIFEYRTIHGRTYHSDKNTNAEYWYIAQKLISGSGWQLTVRQKHRTPNDERMANAEDIMYVLQYPARTT